MVPGQIERWILIEAPMDVVWAVVTEPEHISGWFSDAAELDLRPGGAAQLRWDRYGTVHARVERVEPQRVFAFRWVVGGPGEQLTEENSTLVEFRLDAEDDSRTRLTVIESGFDKLAAPEDERLRQFEDHQQGWTKELGELGEYVTERGGP